MVRSAIIEVAWSQTKMRPRAVVPEPVLPSSSAREPSGVNDTPRQETVDPTEPTWVTAPAAAS